LIFDSIIDPIHERDTGPSTVSMTAVRASRDGPAGRQARTVGDGRGTQFQPCVTKSFSHIAFEPLQRFLEAKCTCHRSDLL